MSERLAEIKALVELVPNDPFPLYGLALEYRSLGDLQQAEATFVQLAERHPDYVPQYLIRGKLLKELGQRERAIQVLTLGVEKAQKARNHHALGELQGELDSLENADD
ncbi:MAG TPA: hypothetical protein PLA87_15895 [Pseudomonadota bacterium]|jgi:tetratricopeptide (TPR) repeat protein|nr:hypothetical protein [Pseudomonadota bacterium]